MLTRTVSGRTFTFSHSIGRLANAGAGFRLPVDLATAPGDVLYVLNRCVEYRQARVTKCTMDQEFLLEFGRTGAGDGEFLEGTSIAIDDDENVYVVDEALNRISVFDKDGDFLGKWGEPGSGDGELSRPWGLAFDKDENLWIVESGNNRVQKFTKEGKYLAMWGEEGTREGELNMPWGITLDDKGDVYVADWYNSRVQKFNPEGQYLMSFGSPGSGKGELHRPSGVAVDEEGDVYVVDWGSNQVHAYGPDGSYLTTFLGDAHQLPKWGQMTVDANPDFLKGRNRVKSLEPESRFCYPSAVKFDRQRRIVITDVQRGRIQIYIKEKDYVEPQFNL